MWAMGCSQDQNEEEEGDGDLSSWRRRRILGEQGGIGGDVGGEVGVCEL